MKSKDIHATTPAPDHGHTGPPACVQVRGARQNNLKNIDVDVPRDAFVVFTGMKRQSVRDDLGRIGPAVLVLLTRQFIV